MRRFNVLCTLALLGCVLAPAQSSRPAACARVTLSGEVNAAQSWSAPIGQGWAFRLLPIPGGYSGWDLVVDRDPPAGYPDALLLATPPFNSINEREVGTTYGLRAQDALGWNPRSFHFLTSTAQFEQARKLFPVATRLDSRAGGSSAAQSQAMQQLAAIVSQAASGEFRILDARIVPGTADAAPYAENWGIAAAKTPHSETPPPAGHATPGGALLWIRFSVTLWLPQGWKAPQGVKAAAAPCQQ